MSLLKDLKENTENTKNTEVKFSKKLLEDIFSDLFYKRIKTKNVFDNILYVFDNDKGLIFKYNGIICNLIAIRLIQKNLKPLNIKIDKIFYNDIQIFDKNFDEIYNKTFKIN